LRRARRSSVARSAERPGRQRCCTGGVDVMATLLRGKDYAAGGCTVDRLSKRKSIEEGTWTVPSWIPREYSSCCWPSAAGLFSGRSGRLASTADKRDQPMSESTGRRRRSISIITVVYASHLYCTGQPTPPTKGDTGCVPLPPTPGVNPYNNRKLWRGGAA
jgi:hypothetical protein